MTETEDPNKNENADENKRGQDEGAAGKMPDVPWARPFETPEHYEERRAAYEAGHKNAIDQKTP